MSASDRNQSGSLRIPLQLRLPARRKSELVSDNSIVFSGVLAISVSQSSLPNPTHECFLLQSLYARIKGFVHTYRILAFPVP